MVDFTFIKDSLLAIGLGLCFVSKLQVWFPNTMMPLDIPNATHVDALLAHRSVLHVGGQHRGGTTILWQALAAAGAADAAAEGETSAPHKLGRITAFDEQLACRAQNRFGCKGAIFGCSCMESEGLFVQSVLPTWRLEGSTGDGLGRFALWNGTRLSEADLQLGDREKLFADWGPLWGLLPSAPGAPFNDSLLELTTGKLPKVETTEATGAVAEVLLEKTP